MLAVFSHAIRFEIADKNPITPVRQSAKRTTVPIILDPAELRRLFGELGIRERAMIIVDALTGIRRILGTIFFNYWTVTSPGSPHQSSGDLTA
jgi:hypothetical protein